MDKKALSERDICSKYITPAVVSAGWDSDQKGSGVVLGTQGRGR